MKKLILMMLITASSYGQSVRSIMTFYYGSKESLGVNVVEECSDGFYIGGGFSATDEKNKAIGQFYTSKIQPSEWDNLDSRTTQKWFNLYSTFGFGYFKKILVTYDLGVGMYGRHANFTSDYGDKYFKKDKLTFRPTVGINANYEFNQHVGMQLGFNNFDGVKLGLFLII